jgi:hypothetical protein
MDPFEIPIILYRNAGYSMPVGLQDSNNNPYPTPGYLFRLEISPTRSDNSWASPPAFAQTNVAGSGDSGTVFVLTDADTNKLDFRVGYAWRVLTRISSEAVPAALIGGSCTVLDGPSIPEVNPV